MALAPLLNTGFEAGLLSAHGGTVTGAGATVTAGAARNGSYGLHIVSPLNTQTSWDTPSFASTNKFCGRIALKLSSRPSAGAALAAFTTAGGSGLNVQATGAISAIFGGTQVTGDIIDTTGFHVIEWQCDVVAKTMDWKIDGVAQTQVVSTGTPVAVTLVRFGSFDNTNPAYTADIDDVILGSWTVAGTDWWGDGKGIGLRPASDGTHAFTTGDFSPGDAGTTQASSWSTAWQGVDDSPWSATRSTTDNIAQRVAYTTNTAHYVELVPGAVGETGVGNSVIARLAYSSSTTTANTAGCIVLDGSGAVTVLWGNLNNASGGTGGTSSPFGTADYSESSNFFKNAMIAAPAGGWTPTNVNALRWRFGSSTDVSPIPTAQALLFEVDWPIATGTDWTATPADTLSVADAIDHFDLGEGIADSAGVADAQAMQRSVVMAPADSASVADAQAFGRSTTQNDSASVADSSLAERGLAVSPSDSLSVADGSATQQGFGVAAADTLTVADAQALARTVQQAIGDTLTVADAQTLARDIQQAVADTASVTDSVSLLISITASIADSLVLADALIFGYGLASFDTATVADALVTSWGVARSQADALTVSDALRFDYGEAVSDALSIADSQARGISNSPADVLIVADSTATASTIARSIADALGLDDDQLVQSSGQSAPYLHMLPPLDGVVTPANLSALVFLVVADGTVTVIDASGVVASFEATGSLV